MTPQENRLLQDFLDQLGRARAGVKDREAQALVAAAFARQPDAAYLVVQRALLLEQALKQAQAQLAQLQEQGSSFIGGGGSASRTPAAAAEAGARVPGAGSGWGSFLGNAAATAAGVAGGAFLFHGLENLFGDHHGNPASPDDAEDLSAQDLDDPGDDSSWA